MGILREFVRIVLQEKREPFDPERFKQLQTREEMEEYLDFHTKVIGAGVGRTAYDVGGGAVVKLAANKNGIKQNRMEANTFQCAPKGAPVVRVRKAHPAGFWVLVDRVEAIGGSKLKQAIKATVGLPDADELAYVIDAGWEPKEADASDVRLHQKLYNTNEWYRALFDTVKGCEINPLELHEGNWGLDENGDLVLLDTGG